MHRVNRVRNAPNNMQSPLRCGKPRSDGPVAYESMFSPLYRGIMLMKLDGIFSPTILENVTATEFLVCFVMKRTK